jgi:hypothetical protein
MNFLNSIGPRQFPNASPSAAATQQDSKATRANAVKDVNAGSAVSLSSNAVDLQKRVESLGNKTVDMAQDLIGSFAKSLLGDNAKGASISFDSVALESNASFAAGALRAEGSGGVTDAFGFSLSEDSHFLGKGTITTADGRKLNFEVEIQYESRTTAAAASSRRQELADQNPAMPLPEVEFPDIDFPGSLADLFRLMDRNISATVKQLSESGQENDAGNLTMRLLKLVDAEAPLEAYLPPNASEKARAYGRLQAEPGQAAELAHAAKAARGSEIDPPEDAIDPPSTDIDPPSTEIDPPSTEIDPPSTEIDPPSARIDPPSVAIDPPSTEIDPPSTEIDPPASA